MTNEQTGAQGEFAEALGHLRHMGLIPTPAKKRRVLSIEERRERIAVAEASEKRWNDETARIQERTAKAQKAYDRARAEAAAANDELTALRAELARLTADHVEKRDAIRAELHQGRSETLLAACRTLDAEQAACFAAVPRGAGFPAEARRDARLEGLRLLRQEVESAWSRLEDTDAELVARFNAELAKVPAIKAAA